MDNIYRKAGPDYKKLFMSILLSEGVGLLSSLFTKDAGEIYECLIKPGFAPPGWIFAPVWVILYFLMGVAAYRVFMVSPGREDISDALFYYRSQLVFNFMWSILFFTFCLRGVAFLDILILLIIIVITTIKFYRIDKIAGYLMVPYLLWVMYASVLNYAILVLNEGK